MIGSFQVVPDVVHNDDMDIRQYVKIKKIPCGEKSDCRIVCGVVCTKNVVHKKMAKSITEPHILMLACPVDFQVRLVFYSLSFFRFILFPLPLFLSISSFFYPSPFISHFSFSSTFNSVLRTGLRHWNPLFSKKKNFSRIMFVVLPH